MNPVQTETSTQLVTLADILAAQQRVKGVAFHTPLIPHPKVAGLYFKAESLQPIGAFKIRGAYNKIASLPDAERKRGVITYSSGNHAQAVTYAARAFGIRAVIVMPNNAPPVKQEGTRALGAEIVLVGPASSERLAKAEELSAKHGYVMVPPYDDPAVVAGQGTCGLEILADLPDVELVLAPVSGGGMLSGAATAIKLSGSKAKVFGVEPELAGDSQESFRLGKLVEWPAEKTTRTICDGLRTQSLGRLNFEHIRKYCDDIVTVTEDEIRRAIRELATEVHIVAEPSGAVTYAAWRWHRNELPPAEKIACIITGGNIDPKLLREVLA
ncbi:MAG: threonine/serine dehydratase [Candidatus Koribacter versatilis]|uniref:Threonine/serine dehydratase n=1 Tax=Candidatus Korobacter versatilis TaxID=658062 RepID=A0A932EPM2_9BACT|nr:threonine/serine dehydratase [Candidatus Koribacter versatilis]